MYYHSIYVNILSFQEEQKVNLLDGLLHGSLSFSEVENESHESKSVETLKEAFVKQVGCTWAEAVREVPQYADVGARKKYKVTKGKTLPEEFKVKYPLCWVII